MADPGQAELREKMRPATSKQIALSSLLVLNFCFIQDSLSTDIWHMRDQSLNTPK